MTPTLRGLAIAALVALLPAPALAQAPRFYPDDPLRREPTPLPVADIEPRSLSAMLETINNTFRTVGQRHPPEGIIPAQGVNTLGEVMDGDWYVNRHATHRMTIHELRRGPGEDRPPAIDAPWQVLVVKPFGVNPGLLIADSKRDLYLLRFDRRGYEGLATGAEIVSSRLLHALGYFVPENYLVRFDRSRLVASEEGQAVSSAGKPRALVITDIEGFLREVPRGPGRTYRAVATRVPERREALLGPFQMWGTRSDDPNDVIPHEHRRELRGLYVFSAWINNTLARAVNTIDILTPVEGVPRIRHYLVDFTRSLGSGMRDGAKLAWEGHEAFFPGLKKMGRNMASLGVVTPAWMKVSTPGLPEVGTFGSDAFEPDSWTANHPVPPFENRLPDDTFWAAKQVMAFTDEEIRATVHTGQFSEPAANWIAAALIERRNRIGRVYLSRVLPLDRFRVTGNTLEFDDVGSIHRLWDPRTYTIEWHGFDNAKNTLLSQIGSGPSLPQTAQTLAPDTYVAARVHAGDPAMTVTVFLRRRADGFEVVGLDRAWPGKVVAPSTPPTRAAPRLYEDLAPSQQRLFETYNTNYNTTRGSRYTPQEGFARLSLSEQTTFYAVTHALINSTLTDANGTPLGEAIERLESIERVAGQVAGVAGDQQFRLFVTLKPDTREVLEKSREFFRDHENTVYHVGYPHSYRQVGKEPNIQISISADGLRADIDVDYRSSKSPQGLFNGHLTSANSDVRVGDNSNRHIGRWQGLIPWWQEVFGRVTAASTPRADLLSMDRPDAAPTSLPPDRPMSAAPETIEDAAQEFLTDWLIRRQYDQALAFLSPQAYACLDLDDNAGSEAVDAAGARRELRRLMAYAVDRLGAPPNLTDAVLAPTPRDPKRVVVNHAFRREFLLTPLAETEARTYLCGQASGPSTGAEYYGVVIEFRRAGGGTLGMLWTKEGGQWKLVSYRPITQ